MKRPTILTTAGLAALLLASGAGAQAQNIRVRVNDEPVRFYGTQPRMVDGRVMVPLRGVLEQLGATVDWMNQTQTVVATKGDREIDLPVGSHTARINGRDVYLDAPARVIAGSTMVPLRFVGQALGADVAWSDATQTVNINTNGVAAAAVQDDNNYRPSGVDRNDRYYRDNQVARNNGNGRNTQYYRGGRRMVIPSGTVVPVKLDTDLSSNESREGDTFTATVVGGDESAGLPDGTRVEGTVAEAVPSRNGKPGVLTLDVNRLVFPDGATQRITAKVASLDSKSIEHTSSGRLVAKKGNNNEQLKWVGIGAGAGLLLSTLTKGNTLVDTLLGAGAGYLYNQLQHKGAGNVHLGSGTEFGVRMDRQVAFNANRP